MAKRFMYVSVGVLFLVAAYQLGVERARADWDISVSGQIVGGDHYFWYTASGEAWYVDGSGWSRASGGDLPLPGTDVKFLYRDYSTANLVTHDDVAWFWEASQGWTNMGPFPGGPVALDEESWGSVKAKHRKTLEAVFATPTRSNVAWSDVEALLDALGAELSEGRGSRVRIALNGVRAVFHRPHPRKETDKGALISMRRFLSEAGVTP